MSFLDLFREKRTDEYDQLEELDASVAALVSGVQISRYEALQIPAVQYCIDFIAGTIAGFPIRLYNKKTKEEITDDHRLYLLNIDTKDTLTATQFWRAMIEDYYIGRHGGFAYIHRSRNKVVSLNYVAPNWVSIQKNEDPIFKDYMVHVNGKKYRPYEFLKIMRKTKDGSTNSDIVSENSEVLSVAYNTYRYQNQLLKKGGNKKGFLQSDKPLSKEAMAKLREAFRNLYSTNDENIVILNNGMTFKESSNTSVEMQINDTIINNTKDILRIFGLDLTKSNGSYEFDRDEILRAITRVLEDIESSLNRDLLLEKEKDSLYFAFDTRIFTRGNIKERFEAYATGISANILQIDEARELEDLEPLGMKWMTLGLNQVLYDPKTGTVYTPNTKEIKNLNGSQSDSIDESLTEGGEDDADRSQS